MRQMVFLFILVAAAFFAWRYLMARREKRVATKWGWRAGVAIAVGLFSVGGLFAVLSLTSWRLF